MMQQRLASLTRMLQLRSCIPASILTASPQPILTDSPRLPSSSSCQSWQRTRYLRTAAAPHARFTFETSSSGEKTIIKTTDTATSGPMDDTFPRAATSAGVPSKAPPATAKISLEPGGREKSFEEMLQSDALFKAGGSRNNKQVVKQFAEKTSAELGGPEKTFDELLQADPLFKMGRPQDKRVVGVISHVVDQHLYVDFGGKFEAVVPWKDDEGKSLTGEGLDTFRVGEHVVLLLKSFEKVGKFLGERQHITVCEADAKLLSKQTRRSRGNADFMDLLNREELL